MKNQPQENKKEKTEFITVISTMFITALLLIAKQFDYVHIDTEILIAPIIVFTILIYGESMLFKLLLLPIKLAHKLVSKLKSTQ